MLAVDWRSERIVEQLERIDGLGSPALRLEAIGPSCCTPSGQPSPPRPPEVRSHTAYLTFTTPERRQFVRITDDVQRAVDESGVEEGMVLVSAMHITAGVWVNDDEPGILEDTLEWLDKLAPPSWKPPREQRRGPAGPTPATSATTAAARTTATRTGRTCWSTTRS